ncbi:MAG: hypothetical protein GWN01_14865 [Nitrosopumilaceae archaeon]|nr:hypothetical protein [Nitrosopumilaceae archaeon]NIU02132.1 hypothetical protein [Nitrosopumilaceae archaeon]NIU88518.1 hypothetical protein [Nitrosopumilaceae archaeon]NIV67165.1 hypothetical protein [Nitrosopumilaceae archaeon]NIX62733.1 hypothetical protein [Nitrosopumilaceae archaeon]
MEGDIQVRFRFDGESEFHVVRLSYKQYLNLKKLPITADCEIAKGAKITLSEEDKKLLVEKIEQASKESKKSHTRELGK